MRISYLMSYRLLIALFIVTFVASGCAGVSSIAYIVPDDYEGFLVVRYDCPNGRNLPTTEGKITIEFNGNGTSCVANSYNDIFPTGVSTIDQVQSKSGVHIPWTSDLSRASGVYLIDIQVMRRQNSSGAILGTFSILWVGNAEKFRDMYASDMYMTELAHVLEAGFGIALDNSSPED